MRHHTLAAALVLALASASPALAGDGWHIWQSGTIGCALRFDIEQIVYLPPTRRMSRSLLNIAKRPLPRLTLRGVSLTSKDAVS